MRAKRVVTVPWQPYFGFQPQLFLRSLWLSCCGVNLMHCRPFNPPSSPPLRQGQSHVHPAPRLPQKKIRDGETTLRITFAFFRRGGLGSELGPEAPRVAAVKKLNLLHRGKCRGFFVNFFAAIFPGNWRTKICEKFRQHFAAFFADLFETFRKNFALGDCGHKVRDCVVIAQPPKKNRSEPKVILKRPRDEPKINWLSVLQFTATSNFQMSPFEMSP